MFFLNFEDKYKKFYFTMANFTSYSKSTTHSARDFPNTVTQPASVLRQLFCGFSSPARPIKQTFRLKLSKCWDTNNYYSIKLKLNLFSSCIYSEQIKLYFIPWRNSLCKVKPSKYCWGISQRYVTVFCHEWRFSGLVLANNPLHYSGAYFSLLIS